MAYTPITPPKGPFHLIVDPKKNPAKYILDGVPSDATEVLIYAFISVRDARISEAQRAFYKFLTDGNKYMHCMNAIFTRDDYVMNSSNMWLPLGKVPDGENHVLTVDLFTMPWPSEDCQRGSLSLENIDKWIGENHKKDKAIYAQIYILGYRK